MKETKSRGARHFHSLLLLGAGLFFMLLIAFSFCGTRTQAATAMKVSAANKADGIHFSWGKVSGASYYKFYYSHGGTAVLKKVTATSYVLSAANGGVYKYNAYAYNKSNKLIGQTSATASIRYLSPVAISSVTENASAKLVVKWAQNKKGDGYILKRSTDGGTTYVKIKEISGNGTLSYTDTSTTIGKQYRYRIYAKYGSSHSCASTFKNVVFNHTWATATTPATCTSIGHSTTKCKYCKLLKEEKTLNAIGHKWKTYKVMQEATCQNMGFRRDICSNCKETKDIVLEKVDCKKTAINRKEVDCTKGGTLIYRCKWCGKDMGSEDLPPKAHTVVKDPAVKATTTTNGKTEGSHCAVCGAILVAQKIIPMTTKVTNEKLSSVTNSSKGILVKWKKASKADGYILYRKAGSGKFRKYKVIPKKSRTKFLDKKVKTGKLYAYKVAAYRKVKNKTAVGILSKAKKTVRITRAKFRKGTAPSADTVKISWKKQKRISGYQIKVKSGNQTMKTGTVKKTATSAIIKGLNQGSYKIYLRAYAKKGGKTYYGGWTAKPVTFTYPGNAVIR